MKIEQRGFGITDIGARVAGIDVENGGLRIAFVANVASEGGFAFAPPLDADDVKALIEALTVAHGLMTGEAAQPVRKLVGLKDRAGDIWVPTLDGEWGGDSDLKTGHSREYVESEWGPVVEVFE